MTKDQIQKSVAKNRELIDKALHTNIDIGLLYDYVRMLSDKNERLLKRLNDTN